jgi:hypothetical protein
VNVRRSIAAAAVLLTAPALSACGINFAAQTDQDYNPAVGVNDRTGMVDVLNALIVSGADGSGTVVATLVNNDQQNADSLRGVAGAGDDSGLTASTGGTTDIPAGGLLNLAEDGRVSIRGEGITPGSFVEITFSFERGKAVTMKVPVVSSSDSDYSDVPLPSGS